MESNVEMKMKHDEIVPILQIESRILEIRGEKVMIDADLADIYGVPTKAFNQAVKRNLERFPRDFMFQLTKSEKEEVVTSCDHLAKLKYSPVLPHVFTEHGAFMAANMLNSPRAVEVSVYVVRAFVRLRELISSNKDLAKKLDALEKKYDEQFRVIFQAIRGLMTPPAVKQRLSKLTTGPPAIRAPAALSTRSRSSGCTSSIKPA